MFDILSVVVKSLAPPPERDAPDVSAYAEDPSCDSSEVLTVDVCAEGDPVRGADSAAASRPSSEAYMTASDDSSSLFDEDMQHAECPALLLRPRCLRPGTAEDDENEDVDSAHTNGVDLITSPDDLSRRFQCQRLDSSSSSSGDAPPATPSPCLTPALNPKRPTASRDPGTDKASPKQPRLRTPAPGSSVVGVGLAKRHLSQPMPPPPLLLLGSGVGRGHQHAHKHTRNAISMLRPPRLQETDLDQEQEAMETGGEQEQVEGEGNEEEKEAQEKAEKEDREKRIDATPTEVATKAGIRETEAPPSPPNSVPANKPPTPPLHRFPSWVSVCVCVWF